MSQPPRRLTAATPLACGVRDPRTHGGWVAARFDAGFEAVGKALRCADQRIGASRAQKKDCCGGHWLLLRRRPTFPAARAIGVIPSDVRTSGVPPACAGRRAFETRQRPCASSRQFGAKPTCHSARRRAARLQQTGDAVCPAVAAGPVQGAVAVLCAWLVGWDSRSQELLRKNDPGAPLHSNDRRAGTGREIRGRVPRSVDQLWTAGAVAGEVSSTRQLALTRTMSPSRAARESGSSVMPAS